MNDIERLCQRCRESCKRKVINRKKYLGKCWYFVPKLWSIWKYGNIWRAQFHKGFRNFKTKKEAFIAIKNYKKGEQS
jgi:hypothetical protein